MFDRILVAIDGSTASQDALRRAADLARIHAAALKVITVPRQIPPPEQKDLGWDSRDEAFTIVNESELHGAQRILEAAANVVAGHGVRCDTEVVSAAEAYQGILDAAARSGSDLIVMGSHGRRGIHRLLLGSQATKVIALSAVPVLVCKVGET